MGEFSTAHLGAPAGERKTEQPAARFASDMEAEPWHFFDRMKPIASNAFEQAIARTYLA
jgi:hypothetical protein